MSNKPVKSLSEAWQRRREHWAAKVYIISFPKSGRTWLRVLIGKALCDKYKLSDELMLDSMALTQAAGILPTLYSHDGSSNTEGNRWDELEIDKSKYRRKKVVFLIRDPRDVVVSCFFQATKRKGLFEGSISDFIRDDRYGIRKIVTFYNLWHQNKSVPESFLPLRYEEMHADPEAALRQALEFMGATEIDDGILRGAIEYSSFENMKRMEAEDKFGNKILRPGKSKDEDSFKVRRGKVGGFVDYLNADDCDYVNGVMTELGCPFFPIEPAERAGVSSLPQNSH